MKRRIDGMDETAELVPDPFTTDLEKITTLVQAVAQQHRGNSLDLLAILRMLEGLHQEIRDGLFREALPDNRQALYALLRDIETNGGWPYIHRMKLHDFLGHLAGETVAEPPRE